MTTYVQQQCARCGRAFFEPAFVAAGPEPPRCIPCWTAEYGEITPEPLPLDRVKRAAGDPALPGLEGPA